MAIFFKIIFFKIVSGDIVNFISFSFISERSCPDLYPKLFFQDPVKVSDPTGSGSTKLLGLKLKAGNFQLLSGNNLISGPSVNSTT